MCNCYEVSDFLCEELNTGAGILKKAINVGGNSVRKLEPIQYVSLHLKNLFDEGERLKGSTVKESLTVQKEGERQVSRSQGGAE